MRTVLKFILLVLVTLIVLGGINVFADESPVSRESIVKGKEVPEFMISINGEKEPLTKEKMLGRLYILDFWKTTCVQCKAKMSFLHDMYYRFKDKGLEIISLSLDEDYHEVEEYRKNNWPMPWLHAFLAGGWNNELINKFEVTNLPAMILIDRDGIIIGTNEELSDDGLERVLGEIFND